jgi:uncharacterized cofD-like protein
MSLQPPLPVRPAVPPPSAAEAAALVRAAWPVPRIVAIGGGTGLPLLLRGLRDALFTPASRPLLGVEREALTALVTVADDGGSSGRLRSDYGVLPPGDIRNCLVALADDRRMATMFDYRFDGGGLAGHSLGNLILAALSRLEERFPAAVERAGEILGIQGRVLPATATDVRLVAELANGVHVEGESRIAAVGGEIRRVRLVPHDAPALPEARAAIAGADLVVIGPGSLYTSIIPVLLVRGIAEAIARSGARVVLVMNLMTEPGETDGMSAADHVRALLRHAPGLPVHDVVVAATTMPASRLDAYAAAGAQPVLADLDALRGLGCRPVRRRVLAKGEKLRHDARRLAAAVLARRPRSARA